MSKQGLIERKEYLKNRVNPILEVMVADLMKERPGSVISYMTQWIQKKGYKVQSEVLKKANKKPEGMSSSEEDSDEDYSPPPKPMKKVLELLSQVNVSEDSIKKKISNLNSYKSQILRLIESKKDLASLLCSVLWMRKNKILLLELWKKLNLSLERMS